MRCPTPKPDSKFQLRSVSKQRITRLDLDSGGLPAPDFFGLLSWMKAAYYEAFRRPVVITEVPDPSPSTKGVVIRVEATGLCLSDWHGWQGHDSGISLPHVPGHELAGLVMATGKNVGNWRRDDRVTLPFVNGCGTCPECLSANHQVCDHQFQPGFTHWGSFAEYVAVDYADVNLVRLPDAMDFATAACLGCRFATSFRALVDQGRLTAGEWIAVHGCGGVGLSAIMIANALGAQVVAVDINQQSLHLAESVGALATVNATTCHDVVDAVKTLSGGGVHLSIDALGNRTTCYNSIANLRKRGRHIQIGLLAEDDARALVPMDLVVARELKIIGSHGMQAYRYEAMLDMIERGKLAPQRLITRTIPLAEAPLALMSMGNFQHPGVTVIDSLCDRNDV